MLGNIRHFDLIERLFYRMFQLGSFGFWYGNESFCLKPIKLIKKGPCGTSRMNLLFEKNSSK